MGEGFRPKRDVDLLAPLLQEAGVIGVSHLCIYPSFQGKTACTLRYQADAVRIDVMDERGSGRVLFHGTITRPLRAMRPFGPLASWERLREAAFSAPTCDSFACDGVCYCHLLLDGQDGIKACWGNPIQPEHRFQCALVEAYRDLIQSSGILLEPGTRVRVRTGMLAGFLGHIERFDRASSRVTVCVNLGNMPTFLDLAIGEIEFAGEEQPET